MGSFISTRGSDRATLVEALDRGLARDGGLFVPSRLRRFDGAPPGCGGPHSVAVWAASSLFPEVGSETLEAVVSEALSFPMPMVETEPGVLVLELFHGPTLAFKDVGARFLSGLLEHLLAGQRPRTVLVATSGDTGGAVGDAFRDVPGFRVVVLFPVGGVTPRQRRQLTTLGSNVLAVGLSGGFDDCQRLAKEALLDEQLSARHGLTSANSINVGRLLPQALYYVRAAAELGWGRRPVRFVVPSGNLGNVCSGLLAFRMGMPAGGFLAACNANRALVDVLDGKGFEPRASIPTSSSAMDVGNPSNLERLMWLCGGDVTALRRHVAAVSVTEERVRRCIRSVHERCGYALDPHTAVAYDAALRTTVPDSGGGVSVVLATAHPAKFPDVTEVEIGREVEVPPALARTLEKEEHFVEMPPRLPELEALLDDWGRP